MTTITASTTVGIVLNPASYANPVVFAAGITISNSAGSDAVSVSGAAYVFTIQNNGTISGRPAYPFRLNPTGGTGMYLASGGLVTNAASGLITGYSSGIVISGGLGTVVNDGRIVDTGFAHGGVSLAGVSLAEGGSVTNAASGSIIAVGIGVVAGAGTVVNDGSIVGGSAGFGAYGVTAGWVTNAASASIKGGVNAGTVFNEGSIADGVNAVSLTNAASASITGGFHVVSAELVINAGTIAGTGGSAEGVYLGAGGSLTNAILRLNHGWVSHFGHPRCHSSQ